MCVCVCACASACTHVYDKEAALLVRGEESSAKRFDWMKQSVVSVMAEIKEDQWQAEVWSLEEIIV